MSLTHVLLYFHGQVARCLQGAGECERQGITPVCSEMWQEPKVLGIHFFYGSDLNCLVEIGESRKQEIQGFKNPTGFLSN